MKNFFKTIIAFLIVFTFVAIPIKATSKVPKEVKAACEKWGEEYGICPELLESIAYEESRYTADAKSKDGSCLGLMQIRKASHKQRIKNLEIKDLYDVDDNVQVATDYLAELFEEYEEVSTVLMIYHGEKDAVSKGEQGIVSKYAKKVLKRSEALERQHGK